MKLLTTIWLDNLDTKTLIFDSELRGESFRKILFDIAAHLTFAERQSRQSNYKLWVSDSHGIVIINYKIH